MSTITFNKKTLKNISIFSLIFSCLLHGCTSIEKNYNMESSPDNSYIEANNTKKSGTGKCAMFGLGALAGIIVASAIEIPSILVTKQNQLTSQSTQCSDNIANLQAQLGLFSDAIIPVLTENGNAIYTLANGTNIQGNSSLIYNLNYNDILNIKGINLSPTSLPYTAEEEFSFVSLTQIMPSMTGLETAALLNQYIEYPINLTTTALTSLDLSGTYIANTIVVPQSLNSVNLTGTTICTNGGIICTGGNTLNPNCVDYATNTTFTNFNQQYNPGSLCSNYTQYQQVLTNYTALNYTYQELVTLNTFGGQGACIQWMYQYNNCSNNGEFPYAYDNYTAMQAQYNTCSNNTNTICNTIVYCSGGNLGYGNANQQYGTVQQCCSPANNYPQGSNYGCGNGITPSLALSTLCANQ